MLYDDQVWNKDKIDQKILSVIDQLQNRFLLKSKLNLADEKLNQIITTGRNSINKNEVSKNEQNTSVNGGLSIS